MIKVIKMIIVCVIERVITLHWQAISYRQAIFSGTWYICLLKDIFCGTHLLPGQRKVITLAGESILVGITK